MASEPLLLADRMVIASQKDELIAFSPATGQPFWVRSYAPTAATGPPASPPGPGLFGQPLKMNDGTIFYSARKLEFLSAKDGSVVRSGERAKLDTWPLSPYVTAGGVFEVDGNGRCLAYSLPSLTAVARSLPSLAAELVLSVGDVVYASGRNRTDLMALDPRTGAQLAWLPTRWVRSLAADEKRVYVLSQDGELRALLRVNPPH
jgi:hypothetical protein